MQYKENPENNSRNMKAVCALEYLTYSEPMNKPMNTHNITITDINPPWLEGERKPSITNIIVTSASLQTKNLIISCHIHTQQARWVGGLGESTIAEFPKPVFAVIYKILTFPRLVGTQVATAMPSVGSIAAWSDAKTFCMSTLPVVFVVGSYANKDEPKGPQEGWKEQEHASYGF